MKQGIYKITNLINRNVYIGLTKDLRTRKNEHFCLLNRNKHYNHHLQNAWNKYGANNFKFEILQECKDRQELNERETYWFDYYVKLLGRDKVYNLGHTGNSHNCSEETRKKMSEHNARYWLGKHQSKETIELRASKHRGTHHTVSEETRRKISIANKGHTAWNKGIPADEKTRERLIKMSIGRKHSAETKAKLSALNKGSNNHFYGKKHTVESKLKMRLAKLGKPSLRKKKVIINGITYNSVKECMIALHKNHRSIKQYIIN